MNQPPVNIFGIVGIIASPLALLFGYLRYSTKAGIRIYGSFSTCSSIACNDVYVASVTLENQKDRAITIFAIYLRIGYNYYVEVDNFESSPMILKAYETFKKEYDPIDFYSVSMKRILLNKMFQDKKVPKQLILSTSRGKYAVPKRFRYWNPAHDFFKNHTIATIHPARSTYKGQSYGSNVLYLIEAILEDGTEQIFPVHSRDDEIRRFKNFLFTKESLLSKSSLEAFLKQQQDEGNLVVKSVVVHDLVEWRNRVYDENTIEIEGRGYSRFHVFVMGWIYTRISSWSLRRKNKKAAEIASVKRQKSE